MEFFEPIIYSDFHKQADENPSSEKHKNLLAMLMETAGSKDGQEELKAFREKRKPVCTGE